MYHIFQKKFIFFRQLQEYLRNIIVSKQINVIIYTNVLNNKEITNILIFCYSRQLWSNWFNVWMEQVKCWTISSRISRKILTYIFMKKNKQIWRDQAELDYTKYWWSYKNVHLSKKPYWLWITFAIMIMSINSKLLIGVFLSVSNILHANLHWLQVIKLSLSWTNLLCF